MQNPLEDFSFSDPFSTWWPFILAAIVGVVTTVRSFITGPTCPSNDWVDGKTIVITGGSQGIGLEVVIELVRRGAKVIVATRNPKKTRTTLENRVKSGCLGSFKVQQLDLTKLRSVRNFAQSLNEKKIDVLINNAGIAYQPFQKTEDGFETHLAVNYLGHFLLTHLLLPALRAAEQGRVINTSAQVHTKADLDLTDLNCENNFNSIKAFANSKFALILMARYLTTCWQGTNVTINAVSPGLVRGTNHVNNSLVSRSFAFKLMAAPTSWLLMKTPLQASQSIVYLAVAKELNLVSGRYFSNCSETVSSEKTLDVELARNLHRKSLELVGLST